MGVITWTAEQESALQSLITAGGLSCSGMAVELGTTRSAVASKLKRARDRGEPWVPPIDTRYQPRSRQTERPHNPLGNTRCLAKRVEKRRKENNGRGPALFDAEFALPAPATAPESLRIPFFDRKTSQCAYFDDNEAGDQITCCGHQTRDRASSYCSHHHKVVYGGSSSKPEPRRLLKCVSGTKEEPLKTSIPRKPAVIAVETPHRGRWSRTITLWRLRGKIIDDLEKKGSQGALARQLGLSDTQISRALNQNPLPANFELVAARYGYRRMPGEDGLYVALPALETEAA